MKKIAFVFLIVSVLWSCSTISQHYKSGYEAAMNKDWDKAIEFYEKAVLENPENSVYRLALYRAKVAASYSHLYTARNLAAEGKKEEALKEYEVAFSYDTTNMKIYEEAKRFALKGPEEEKPKEIVVEKHITLDVSDEKIQLKFMQEASLRSIFQALGKHAGVDIRFDESCQS